MAAAPYADEEWRSIAHTPEYEVSSIGRVRRAVCGTGTRPGRVLRQNFSGQYLAVALSSGGKPRTRTVHVLVAEAFCGPKPTAKHHAAHNDGNRLNNRSDNIRWATPYENQLDAQRHQTVWSKLKPEDVAAIRASGLPTVEIARQFGVERSTVRRIVTGKTWRAF